MTAGLTKRACLVLGLCWMVATEVPGTSQEVPGTVQEVPGTNFGEPSREVPGTVQEVPGTNFGEPSREVPGTVQEVPGTNFGEPSREVPGTVQEVPGTNFGEPSREVPGTVQEVPGTSGKPPLVLISIDTLRSDRLPAYGFDGVETPAIDRLRRDGILFRHAYSHAPLTLPSHVSMFTGQLPSEHGIRDNQGYPFTATEDFLPQRLRRQGYATAGAVSAYVLHRRSGFGAEGFDVYDDGVDIDPEQRTLGGVDRTGHHTLDALEPWLRQHRSQPFFLFLHLFEPHLPHTPPEPFASRYGDSYEGEIAAADDVVARLLTLLDDLDLYDSACIVLLSDHGEGLGDHGEEEHGIFLYREALQVPLILKLPDSQRRGDRVEAAAQLVDVYPTLLAAAGIETPATSQGRPLQDIDDNDPHRPIYAETYYPRLHYGWSELTSLIQGRHHLIAGPSPELFDVFVDPAEQHNIVSQQRRRAGELRDLLVDLRRPLQPPESVDAATRERLAALGYLGSSVKSAQPLADADESLPDPKAQLSSLDDLKLARRKLNEGKVEEAVTAYRRLLDANPRLLDGWHALGDVLRRVGRFAEAAQAYGEATELSGGDADFLTATLASQIAAGQLEQASQGLNAASHLSQEQRQGLRRQLANAYESRSLAALQENAWKTAKEAALHATALDEELSEAWNNLGVALWYLDEPQEAIDAWRRAVSLDPNAWDTLYNLGSKAMEVERLDIARDSLKSFIDGAPPADYAQQLRRARVLLRRIER